MKSSTSRRTAIRPLISFVALLLLLPTTFSETKSKNQQNGVVSLDARTFDSSLRDGSVWLVEFYAPWCGHCVKFAPTYEKVAKIFHSANEKNGSEQENKKVMVAKIDGAKERALASRFSIRGYPSFFIVDGWTVRQYEGIRSQEALVKFANETYVEVEPIPFLSSPFGPVGQSRALLMYVGTKLLDVHSSLVEKGLSNVVAAGLLAFSGIMSSLILIIFIGLMLVPKAKVD